MGPSQDAAGPGPAPLSGIRVLDLSRVVSGPFAARMMSDMGADVVKLEPPDGDMTRIWGEVRHGLSGFYTQQNAGKRNICVDLRLPAGVAVARRLAAAADVLIENFRPGVLDRLGLGWATLSELHPGLVLLSISGFAADGPHAGRAAFAPVIHAESGLLARQASFDGTWPSDPMLSIADTNAALHGLAGVLAALLLRGRTGRGQHVRVSMLDSMLATDDYAHHSLDGSPIRRLGGEVWEATGGPVMIAGEFRYLWRQAHSVHGLADPAPGDTPLEEKISRRRQAVGAWLLSFEDRSGLLTALDSAELAWADVRDPMEAFDVPAASQAWEEIDDRGGGVRRVVRAPYRFSDARVGPRRGAPRRGEHNREVIAEWLGAGDEVDGLLAEGALKAEDPLTPA